MVKYIVKANFLQYFGICEAIKFGYNVKYNIDKMEQPLKVLGKSVGLYKTAKRKDQLYIRVLVSVLRIICENFKTNGLLLARL